MFSYDELINSMGTNLYKRAKELIPGGTQLLSKRPEMFAPDLWPSYYSKAKGCYVWDLDGRKLTDMSIMSVGSCILGYADEEIDNSVISTIKKGVNSSLNCPEEVKLAEKLIDLHPWFHMVRYARSGGEAMDIAVRIARAYKKRDTVLFSGYHGWHDWYLAANLSDGKNLDGQLMPGLEPNGVPRILGGSSIPFNSFDIDSLKEKIKGREKKIAAIIIEPARGASASKNYLESLRELANEIEAVLIFDEITSGYRMCPGGIHRIYNVYPDISVFAKSMANGYAMSAVLGKKDIMEASQSTFISSTNWTDRVGPTAALATLEKYIRESVEKHIIKMGEKVKEVWKEKSKLHKIDIDISGLPSLASYTFKNGNQNKLNTIFTIEMLKRGFLGFRQFKPSYAHQDKNIEEYEIAVDEIFKLISLNDEDEILKSKPHHTGFQRLTKE